MKKSISGVAVITFLATLGCYLLIKSFGNIFFEFDSVAHFIGGMFGGSFGMAVSVFFSSKRVSAKRLILWSVIFAFTIGFLWEIFQQYILHGNYPFDDTLLDLIMDTAGGWLVSFAYTKGAKLK